MIKGTPPKSPGLVPQLQQLVPLLLMLLVMVHAIGYVQRRFCRDAGARRPVPPKLLPASPGAQRAAGSLPTAILEGGQTWLIELQALVDPAASSTPHQGAQGLDPQRGAMLLAVLRRHSKLGLAGHDVFVGTVGATDVRDTGANLPLVLVVRRALGAGQRALTPAVRGRSSVPRPRAGAPAARRRSHRRHCWCLRRCWSCSGPARSRH